MINFILKGTFHILNYILKALINREQNVSFMHKDIDTFKYCKRNDARLRLHVDNTLPTLNQTPPCPSPSSVDPDDTVCVKYSPLS